MLFAEVDNVAVPRFLAVLLACYVVGAAILTATKTLHDLRDLATGVKKIEESDRLGKLRVRLAALFNSYIPIWRGICYSLVLLSVILVVSALCLDKNLPNVWVSFGLLCIGAGISFTAALTFCHTGGQDVRAIQESIESEMRSALLVLVSVPTSTVEPAPSASSEKVPLAQLATLRGCVQAAEWGRPGSLARQWRRYQAELRYSVRAFFLGVEFKVGDVNGQPHDADERDSARGVAPSGDEVARNP
jgi:hypothetical protein